MRGSGQVPDEKIAALYPYTYALVLSLWMFESGRVGESLLEVNRGDE
jgi:hypothetical protein